MIGAGKGVQEERDEGDDYEQVEESVNATEARYPIWCMESMPWIPNKDLQVDTYAKIITR